MAHCKLLMRCASQVLDPIDGTKGFMTGQGYMIGLSLLVDGEVIMGVMGILAAPCTVQVSGVRLLSTEMRTVAEPASEMLAVRRLGRTGCQDVLPWTKCHMTCSQPSSKIKSNTCSVRVALCIAGLAKPPAYPMQCQDLLHNHGRRNPVNLQAHIGLGATYKASCFSKEGLVWTAIC